MKTVSVGLVSLVALAALLPGMAFPQAPSVAYGDATARILTATGVSVSPSTLAFESQTMGGTAAKLPSGEPAPRLIRVSGKQLNGASLPRLKLYASDGQLFSLAITERGLSEGSGDAKSYKEIQEIAKQLVISVGLDVSTLTLEEVDPLAAVQTPETSRIAHVRWVQRADYPMSSFAFVLVSINRFTGDVVELMNYRVPSKPRPVGVAISEDEARVKASRLLRSSNDSRLKAVGELLEERSSAATKRYIRPSRVFGVDAALPRNEHRLTYCFAVDGVMIAIDCETGEAVFGAMTKSRATGIVSAKPGAQTTSIRSVSDLGVPLGRNAVKPVAPQSSVPKKPSAPQQQVPRYELWVIGGVSMLGLASVLLWRRSRS